MDYYEELGLDRNAGPEEIRRAYKRLVRLLHPDRCRDSEVKQLADIQMKRLNGILHALTDPVQRAEYDRLQLEPAHGGVLPRSREMQPPLWFWFAAAVMVVAGFLLLPHEPKAGPPPAVATAQPEPHRVPAEAPQPIYSIGLAKVRTRTSPVHPPESLPPDSVPEAPPIPELPAEPRVEPPVYTRGVSLKATAAGRSPKTEHPAPPNPGWNGDWVYVPGIHDAGNTLYPPEFIQLRITQDGSQLHGRYRARYMVSDRAISPAVNFQFDGTPDSEGVLSWTGPGGASGQVHLQMTSNGMLQVSWEADQMGNELGLISGKAFLIRRLE